MFEAEDIARLRKKWKLKRDVFGEFFGVSGEEIRNWERGRNKPAPRHLELLAHIRGMSRKERVALLESIAAEKPAGESLNAAGRRRHEATGFRVFHLTGCGD